MPYASVATDPEGRPLVHACGHDIHTVCLLGALERLAASRDRWSGTVLGVFQPTEIALAQGVARYRPRR